MGKKMIEFVEKLEQEREIVFGMGGKEKIEKQHSRNKLTARERLNLLFDKGTFVEIGMLGSEPGNPKRVPADGVITGYGKVAGRYVGAAIYDFTVKGGSMGMVSEFKVTRIREIVLRERMPLVWLIDSGGARIDQGQGGFGGGEMAALFANSGFLFKEESLMSGVIPLVSAMVGPGFAGTAYIPGLSDFVPMVKDVSFMGLAGPALVKMVTAEDLTGNELGGSKIHCEVSGCGDLEVDNDEACIQAVKEYLSFFPSHCEEKPPRKAWAGDPNVLMDDAILKVLPDNPRQAYDMHKVVKLIADDHYFFEIKPKWARNIIVGFVRIGGFPVGVVANNPMFYAGAIDINASDKAARFIWLCDAFNIPLLFLSDVPGFMVGSVAEKSGIIRHGAKMIHAVAEATVPKLTIVVRKSYGAGYYAMCGKSFDPDLLVAWPDGEIAVMGAEGMISIFARKALAVAEDKEAMVKQLADQIRPFLKVEKAAAWGFIDEVIDPRETRKYLINTLEFTKGKRIFRHPRKHGVYPV